MLDRPLEPKIMTYLFAKASKKRVPLSCAFEITPLCNMSCKMCYVKLDKKHMDSIGKQVTVDEWLELAKQAKEMGVLYILLTGGEPFLHKDFKRLYIELSKMGFVIAINSNGTLIDEEIVSWLSKYPPMRMNITLYGASDETYGRLCNNPRGFTQVTNAVKLMKEAGIRVKFNASMTPYNIDDVDQMYEIAKDLGVQINVATYMFPPIRRDKDSIGYNERFNEEDAGKYRAYTDFKKYSEDVFKYRAKEIMKCKNNQQCVAMDLDDDVKGSNLRCRAGKSTFWMTWNGKMMTCGIMDKPIAYPFKVGLKEAWNSIVEQTEKLILPKECSVCDKKHICQVCGAVCYTESGDISKKPEYVCKTVDEYIKATEELYKKEFGDKEV